MRAHSVFRSSLITLLVFSGVLAGSSREQVIFIPYSDARPILEHMSEVLPSPLKGASEKDQREAWPSWVKQYDSEIRSRLKKGDQDSVINFLLFGISFTKAPRFTPELIRQLREGTASSDSNSSASGLLKRRIADLLDGASSPVANDRLRFARAVLNDAGYDLSSRDAHARATSFLRSAVDGILKEYASYAETLEAAQRLDPTSQLAQRSTLFRNRGLSLDTSWRPNYALEDSLRELKQNGSLTPGSVHRVAIIGPGLDFADKQEGYDFYPQQTLQPFAVLDSLLRLGLTTEGAIQVTTLDISPRVNLHIRHTLNAAQQGSAYTVRLPLDPATKWSPGAAQYWKAFGSNIGSISPAPVPAELKGLELRAVRIRPEFVKLVHPVDLDVVLQRIEIPNPAHRFDLIVATNILVYYDVFGQSLALSNIAAMLRPGGLLLTNNILLELPSIPMHSIGYRSTVYSESANDGDHILWYQRAAN